MAQHNLPPRASLLSPRVDVFSHDGTNANPPTLVLDLDETLTHTEVTPIDDADLVFHLQSCGDDAPQPMFVRKRPHVDHFLRTVAQKFEVVIFTASERPYCESILRFLDPHNGAFWIDRDHPLPHRPSPPAPHRTADARLQRRRRRLTADV
mmetsp:Transcript_96272/g.274242  ORF Transcript_96272/g.274242 Transcript_96272/m.274242 type:complete len:151 (-) Transcript_96272:1173-1625(-)